MSKIEDRRKSEERSFVRVTNRDLVCKDCLYAMDDSEILGNTARCKKYYWKPDKVKLGGECDEYEPAK